MSRIVFVTGAGTEIGKTYVACRLLEAWRRAGGRPVPCKPVASGVPPIGTEADAATDAGRLLAAAGRAVDAAEIEACSPFRFEAPLSPDMAAAREGRRLRFADVAAACRRRGGEVPPGETLLIEGAGGVMSPIAEDGLNLDLAETLGAEVVLVGGSYLGAISHALTALAVCRARGLEVRLVLCESPPPAPDLEDTARVLDRFAPGALMGLIRRGGDLEDPP